MNSILIIDDELGICTALTLALEDKYNVKFATSPINGIKLLKEECFNICLLDLKLGEYSGLDVLEELKKIDKNLIVIIMTAYGSIDSTVLAIKKGAYSYLTKPLSMNELHIIIEQGLKYQRLNEKVEYLSQKPEEDNYYGIIGRSPLMKKVFTLIDKLKYVDTSVLITGESGTGKELVARALHAGKRKRHPFQEINCAAIPEGLLEEEMFGHKKGAFTGAVEDRKGKFEFADKGTIFLDEIGDMEFSLQGKLLRVLQERKVTPIGSNDKKEIDVRVLSATNRNLKEMVEKNLFRKDLYFRLNVVEINIPPLRDRKQDLPLFFNHYIHKYNHELKKDITGLSREASKKLMDYNYPGNVRELSNILEYAMVVSDNGNIDIGDLPNRVVNYEDLSIDEKSIFAENLVGLPLKEIEKRIIRANLIKNDGHRSQTAKVLGISDKGLRNKIDRYDIDI